MWGLVVALLGTPSTIRVDEQFGSQMVPDFSKSTKVLGRCQYLPSVCGSSRAESRVQIHIVSVRYLR